MVHTGIGNNRSGQKGTKAHAAMPAGCKETCEFHENYQH